MHCPVDHRKRERPSILPSAEQLSQRDVRVSSLQFVLFKCWAFRAQCVLHIRWFLKRYRIFRVRRFEEGSSQKLSKSKTSRRGVLTMIRSPYPQRISRHRFSGKQIDQLNFGDVWRTIQKTLRSKERNSGDGHVLFGSGRFSVEVREDFFSLFQGRWEDEIWRQN